MNQTLRMSTAPTSEPVTLTEAKAHLRVDIDTDDDLIASYIKEAREEFENQADRTLFTTTYRLVLDAWPSSRIITLPRPPLVSVTSIVYTDDEDSATTLPSSGYIVDTDAWPGRIVLRSTTSWPSVTLRETGAIVITYVAGYASTDDIPERFKSAIRLYVGHRYENREIVSMTGAVPKEIQFTWNSIVDSAKLEER